jgi:membrane-associated phospholipid phosphatase
MTRGQYIRNGIIAGSIVGIGFIPYTWLGQNTDVTTAARLDMPLDHMIPFMSWTVLLYSWVYTQMFYPLFVIRGEDLFWRTVKAFVFIVSVDLLTYWIYPVTAAGFRPEYSDIAVNHFGDWGAKLTFYVDPPTNLFPSQHLSTALLACVTAWTAKPAWGKVILPLAVAISLSILTMKQHYIADGLAAAVLTFIAWWIFLRGYNRESEERPASSWRGPVAYFVFHGTFYLAMYLAYRSGWTPWES